MHINSWTHLRYLSQTYTFMNIFLGSLMLAIFKDAVYWQTLLQTAPPTSIRHCLPAIQTSSKLQETHNVKINRTHSFRAVQIQFNGIKTVTALTSPFTTLLQIHRFLVSYKNILTLWGKKKKKKEIPTFLSQHRNPIMTQNQRDEIKILSWNTIQQGCMKYPCNTSISTTHYSRAFPGPVLTWNCMSL